MCREDVMGETVKKADNHQDQCVGDHHDSIAEMVNDLAYSRWREEAADRGYGEKDTDHHGVCAVEQHKHIRAEGEEDLFSRAVEQFQHIIFLIFFSEIESLFGFISLTVPGHL